VKAVFIMIFDFIHGAITGNHLQALMVCWTRFAANARNYIFFMPMNSGNSPS